MLFDVIIIGAGVTGCSIARCLSGYDANVLVIEKSSDVCSGTSKANSAIIHAGFDATPSSLMAKLNVEGNKEMKELAAKLDIPYKENGALVICTDKNDIYKLEELKKRGKKNGVHSLRILTKEETKDKEKNITDNVVASLYAPTSGIVCPFTMNIAFAENAAVNGVQFALNTEVIQIQKNLDKEDDIFSVTTSNGVYNSKIVVNAAGVYADKIHSLICPDVIEITARKGEYMLLDKSEASLVSHTIFPLPTNMGKGILVSPTIHGNIILGPTAKDIKDKEDTSTTEEGLTKIKRESVNSVNNINFKKVLTTYAGLRAHTEQKEFIIKENEYVKGFIDCLGIESPGLASSSAIGRMVTNIILEIIKLKKKDRYIEKRKGIIHTKGLSFFAYNKLVKNNPDYARIICRCNNISLAEIEDAINRPIGARSVDGIKHRTLALLGRCQGSFCLSEVLKTLSEKLNINVDDIDYKTRDKNIIKRVIGGGYDN